MPRGDHQLGRLAHELVGDAVVVGVPIVPAHRRRQSQRVAADDLYRPLGRALRVLRAESHTIFAFLRNCPADDARVAIEREAVGKSFGREPHRSPARGRNAIEKRMRRAAGIDLGAV